MKKFTLFLICTVWISTQMWAQQTTGSQPGTQAVAAKGFTTVTYLDPLTISSHTADKPQAKLWNHAGKWFTVLPTAGGTKIFRLDGKSWTDVLTVANNPNSKADCQVVGDLVHIVLFRGGNNSYLVSAEYDAATGTYKPWSQRPANVTLALDSTAETATLAIDSKGRMWIASDAKRVVNVQWSDAPYSTWSAPVTIAPQTDDDDICAVTALPGKIGVLWSNMKEKRFGFRVHADDADPSAWSEEEIPAAQSKQAVGKGMADDHLNMVAASDGTLYCAVKTSYDTPGLPNISLLVRRPSGTWDNLYTVTTGSEGTRPVVLLNQATGKLRVVYTADQRGGDILYRESTTSAISFGPPKTLLSGGLQFNYASSTHQPYTQEVVVLATNMSETPIQAVGVILTDQAVPGTPDQQRPLDFIAYPNPSPDNINVTFALPQDSRYVISLYDMKGAKVGELGRGSVLASQWSTVTLNGSRLMSGIYIVELRTDKVHYTTKVVIRK